MARKERVGIVISNKAEKTIVIATTTREQHPKYGKIVIKTKKFLAHDEKNECCLGNLVIIEECAPISKYKAWTLKKII